jgi:hypothetical protein
VLLPSHVVRGLFAGWGQFQLGPPRRAAEGAFGDPPPAHVRAQVPDFRGRWLPTSMPASVLFSMAAIVDSIVTAAAAVAPILCIAVVPQAHGAVPIHVPLVRRTILLVYIMHSVAHTHRQPDTIIRPFHFRITVSFAVAVVRTGKLYRLLWHQRRTRTWMKQ